MLFNLFGGLFGGGHKRGTGRHRTTDRRAGTRQGPYVAGGLLSRVRTHRGTWRRKRSDTGKSRKKSLF